MKEGIKEKILREIEDNLISENRTYDERDIKKAIEETSKAKDEEELKFLFEMNSKYKLFNGNVFMNDMVKDRIDKIKKELKENEE